MIRFITHVTHQHFAVIPWVLACEADFALRTLPAGPLQWGDSDVQTGPMVMLATCTAEELIEQVSRTVTHQTVHLIFRSDKRLLDVIRAEEGVCLYVLEGSGNSCTGIMKGAPTALLTALYGCSKALTVCTALCAP